MKKILIFLCICMLLISMIPFSVSAAKGLSYTAKYGTPTIDGEAETLWERSEWTQVDLPHDGEDSSNSVIQVKLLWDEDHLYFLAEIMDSNLNAENDIFEVYLDQFHDRSSTYGSDDSQTRFRLSGTVVAGAESGTNAQLDANFRVTAHEGNRYIMEGELSWVDTVPFAGMTMGLEFMYNDGAVGNDFVEAYRWNVDTANGDSAPFASTADFGVLLFADAEGNTENLFEKNNAELLAELKALEAYSTVDKINADNVATIKAAIASVEEKIAAQTGNDAISVKRYMADLTRAKAAVEQYEKNLADKLQGIRDYIALYDAITALRVTGINGSNYKSALADYEAAKQEYDALPANVKSVFKEDGLYEILKYAKMALNAYVPTKADIIAEHQELYDAIKALTTNITAENYASALNAYNEADIAYGELDEQAKQYFEEDGMDELLKKVKDALDHFDSNASIEPELPEDTGCKSVLSIGVSSMLLLFGAWVAIGSRKKEY